MTRPRGAKLATFSSSTKNARHAAMHAHRAHFNRNKEQNNNSLQGEVNHPGQLGLLRSLKNSRL